MKTKHFLITTEDGSAVAVVKHVSNQSFLDSLELCLREQLDDISISLTRFNFGLLDRFNIGAISYNMNKAIFLKCTKIEIY